MIAGSLEKIEHPILAKGSAFFVLDEMCAAEPEQLGTSWSAREAAALPVVSG
jgi:hypothetical protein